MSRNAMFLLAAVLLAVAARAEDLRWRVSVKFILDANGQRAASGSMNTDAEVDAAYAQANAFLASFGSPFAFEVVEIVDLPGFAQWFNQPIDQDTRDDLEAAAESNPAGYLLRGDALNVYVLGSTGGGWCNRPFGNQPHIYILGQSGGVNTPFHEAGHIFGLCHTHGCVPSTVECVGSPCVGGDTPPTSDELPDTLPDKDCWSRDEIACYNFGDVYAGLSSGQQDQVDDVWLNIMSYHGNASRLTLDQLDVMAVTSNQAYAHAASGIVQYVGGLPIVTPNGLVQNSHAAIPAALLAAALAPGDDVLVIRPGTYSQAMIINQPVCLRASRGDVMLGQ